MSDHIDWQTTRANLNKAITKAGPLAPLGQQLLSALNAAGKAYEASGKFVSTTTAQVNSVTGAVSPANVAEVDRLTREGLGHFGIDLAAHNLGPWNPGVTNVPVLSGRLCLLQSSADAANDSFWLKLIREAMQLLTPPVTSTKVLVTTITGNPSSEATAALNAALADASNFLGVLSS